MTTIAISGRQSAKNTPRPTENITRADAAVVFTVNAAAAPGATDLGLTEQVGAKAGVGVTAQVKATELLNPPAATTFNVEVDDPPALTVAGVSAEAVREKSDGMTAKFANTSSAELMVRLQAPVPEQGASQPVNVLPAAGTAVRVTAEPLGKNSEHMFGQATPFKVKLPWKLTVLSQTART